MLISLVKLVKPVVAYKSNKQSKIVKLNEVNIHIMKFMNDAEKVIMKRVCKFYNILVKRKKECKVPHKVSIKSLFFSLDLFTYFRNEICNVFGTLVTWRGYTGKVFIPAIKANAPIGVLECISKLPRYNGKTRRVNTGPLLGKQDFHIAVKVGNLRTMQWLWDNILDHSCAADNDTETMSEAAKTGDIQNIKWLREKGYNLTVETLVAAISVNKNVKWLISQNCPLSHLVFREAAKSGDLKIMKLLKKHNCPWDNGVIGYAIEKGIIKNIKWLIENDYPMDGVVFSTACWKGHIPTIRLLIDSECLLETDDPRDNCFVPAVNNGDLVVMKLLYQVGLRPNEEAFLDAVQKGNMRNIHWLNSIRCPKDIRSFYEAISNKKFRNIKLLEQLDCPYDSTCYGVAAEHQNFRILKWLKSKGVELTEDVFTEAILANNFQIVKWLYYNGCPVNEMNSFLQAIFTDNIKLLRFLKKINLPLFAIVDYKGQEKIYYSENIKWYIDNCTIILENDISIFDMRVIKEYFHEEMSDAEWYEYLKFRDCERKIVELLGFDQAVYNNNPEDN
jgi:hypothetical protein